MISVFMSVDQIRQSVPLTFPTPDDQLSSDSSAVMCQSVLVICRGRQIETAIAQRGADCHTDDDL